MVSAALKGVLKAIFTSMFTFPSCAFWVCSVSTIFFFFVAGIVKFRSLRFAKLPSILELIDNERTSIYFKITAVVSSCFLVYLNYYIHNYYTRSHWGSGKKIQRLLKNYLFMYHFTSFLYITFFMLSTFGDQTIGYLRHISFALFFFTHAFIHVIPKSIVRLKHNNRKLPGWALINMEALASIVSAPLFLYCSFKGIDDGYMYSAASLLYTISYLMNGLSFVFDAISVLGHRFIKYHRYCAPRALSPGTKKKVAAHV
jgi:hypothetical protein